MQDPFLFIFIHTYLTCHIADKTTIYKQNESKTKKLVKLDDGLAEIPTVMVGKTKKTTGSK